MASESVMAMYEDAQTVGWEKEIAGLLM